MKPVMIITGGSRGIGAATARLAAGRGYAICINFVSSKEKAHLLADEINAAGGEALAVHANIAEEDDVLRLFRTCDQEMGDLAVLVNNAGILERQTRVEKLTAARLDRLYATNVRGAFLCAREAVKRMSTARGGNGGAIVNVSSIAARLGAPDEYVDYAATKGAMDTMTIGLSKEVAAEGIRVNSVRPGIIETEIHASGGEPGRPERIGPTLPMKRAGTAEEVARAILWLASDEASYTSGSFIEVSGGR